MLLSVQHRLTGTSTQYIRCWELWRQLPSSFCQLECRTMSHGSSWWCQCSFVGLSATLWSSDAVISRLKLGMNLFLKCYDWTWSVSCNTNPVQYWSFWLWQEFLEGGIGDAESLSGLEALAKFPLTHCRTKLFPALSQPCIYLLMGIVIPI